jgi:hypothetical protein
MTPRVKDSEMDERELRVGLNEAVYRQVNERLQDLNEAFATVTDTMKIVCECGSGTCTEEISLTPVEYEQLRADPHLFAVVRGHEVPEVESVVDKRETYDIVKKDHGSPKRIAEFTDPRG